MGHCWGIAKVAGKSSECQSMRPFKSCTCDHGTRANARINVGRRPLVAHIRAPMSFTRRLPGPEDIQYWVVDKMARRIIRTSEDGTTTSFSSITLAASGTEGVAKTSLLRLLKSGKSDKLGGFNWAYERAPEAATQTIAGPSNGVPQPERQDEAQQQAYGFFESLKTDDGQLITEMRLKDGFINATAMVQSAGKRFNDYASNDGTTNFLNALSADTLLSVSELVQSKRGGSDQGTWVHPDVAIHLAQWCSPVFAVKVSQLVRRYAMGKITTEESRAAAGIVRDAIIDQEYVERKRKLEIAQAEWELEEKRRDRALADKREEIEISRQRSDSEIKELRTNPVSIARFYKDVFESMSLVRDGKDDILIKDAVHNAMTGASRSEKRVLMPISDIVRSVTGRIAAKADCIAIGKAAAEKYREINGRDPPQAGRLIDGTERMINCYTQEDADGWLLDIVRRHMSSAPVAPAKPRANRAINTFW